MAISHRKLLSEPDYSNQPIDCSLCGSSCPYDCDYAAIYWPPQLPPPPPPPTTNNTTHISPFLIIIVALIACAILLISYFLIIKRYCTRFRQPFATQVNNESQDFMNEDHHPEIDHPIWYINTIGLQPAVIRSIKVVRFKKGENIIDVTDCSVCLSEFEDDESLRLLPKCNHAFHVPCIDMWLRSHTNCPLCRAAVLSNNSNTSSQLNDEIGSQMENEENEGELGLNSVQETGIEETQDSKTEIESVSRLRRSFSMDAAAVIVHTESNSSNSGIEIQSLNHVRDLRTRSMMTMRSFSYGGRSIM